MTTPTFDFSRYYAHENEEENESQMELDEPQTIEKSFDFEKYKAKDDKPKTFFEETKQYTRGPLRTAARAIESVLGLPGDIREFIKSVEEYIPESPILPGKESFISKTGRAITEIFPTSEELKNLTSYLTSGFTDPQDAYEEFGDEITSLAATLAIPMKNPTKFKTLLKGFGKALGKSATAKGIGIGAEQFGATEKQKAAAEIGTLLTIDFLGGTKGKYIDRFLSDQYKQARGKIPKGTILNTSPMNKKLDNLETGLKKGLPKTSATKPPVLDIINEIKTKTAGGSSEAEEILESIHDINSKISSRGLFADLSKPQEKILRKRFDDVKSILYDTLGDYGKNNPEFFKELMEYNKAYSVLSQSRNVKQFILSNIKNIPKDVTAGLAFKLLFGGPAVPAAAAGIAAYRSGRMLNRVAQSKKLRQFYIQAATSAMKEDLPGVINNLKKLDKELKDENDLQKE